MFQLGEYQIIKFLGKGSFGEVYLATKYNTTELFAAKKISRQLAQDPSFQKYLMNEISILKIARHPNIVKFEEFKETQTDYYLIMEYCNGGCLSDCLKQYREIHGKPFPEEIVQHIMCQIISAVKFLHQNRIIHRDLKLDNIMIKYFNEQDKQNLNLLKAQVKIIDFGFAIQLVNSNLAFDSLGSPFNMDPIILQKLSNKKGSKKLGYDEKADIWSLGTLCYEMVRGKKAFDAETLDELLEKVEIGKYTLPISLSSEIVDFLKGMLKYKGVERLSADELSRHPFIVKNIQDFTYNNNCQINSQTFVNDNNPSSIWDIFNKGENNNNNQLNNNQYNNNQFSNNQFNNNQVNNNNQLNYNQYNNNQFSNNQLDNNQFNNNQLNNNQYNNNQFNNNQYNNNQLNINKFNNNQININQFNNNYKNQRQVQQPNKNGMIMNNQKQQFVTKKNVIIIPQIQRKIIQVKNQGIINQPQKQFTARANTNNQNYININGQQFIKKNNFIINNQMLNKYPNTVINNNRCNTVGKVIYGNNNFKIARYTSPVRVIKK